MENIIICSANCAQSTNLRKCEVIRKRGKMKYWGNYYTKVAENEKAVRTKKMDDQQKANVKSLDADNLIKIILAWFVGGIISLMPTFTYIITQTETNEDILEQFFANKDLFLVITTLTVSTLLELIFNGKNSITKYVVVSLEVILIVFSMHIFSLLQYTIDIPYKSHMGASLLTTCIVICIVGYFIVCWKRRDA